MLSTIFNFYNGTYSIKGGCEVSFADTTLPSLLKYFINRRFLIPASVISG